MYEVEVIKADRKISDRNINEKGGIVHVAPYVRVSTDTEEQLSSYHSQLTYYRDLVDKHPDWELVDLYADEAITGTNVDKREGFQKMIRDCMDGRIDMVITKSISRFARNTLDTLKYVRMLKEKNIAVLFEDEKINTMTMDGELLLVVLSSVAQQEVENISANVKKGLKMKMKRGELVGFSKCLGYDYDPVTKRIYVNHSEAEIVKYIFNRYSQGIGGHVIARELTEKGYRPKSGNGVWHETTILKIIKNEKYIGDLRQGKTFTVDPISKRRLQNFGEEDQYYIKDHHEPIITRELFEKAHVFLNIRQKKVNGELNTQRERYTRKYAFSSKIKCGYCGKTYVRRLWHCNTQHQKVIWQCASVTKNGKASCLDSKGVSEDLIEDAFVDSYQRLCYNNAEVLDDLMDRILRVLSVETQENELCRIDYQIKKQKQKLEDLTDLYLEKRIDKKAFETRQEVLKTELSALTRKKREHSQSNRDQTEIKKRIELFRSTLKKNESITTFHREVFESIVDKVIIGGVREDGTKAPYQIMFVYKTGLDDEIDMQKMASLSQNRANSLAGSDTCRDVRTFVPQKFVNISTVLIHRKIE